MGDQGLTLLSEGQIWGNDSEPQLEVIRKYGVRAAFTDLCALTGGHMYDDTCLNVNEDNTLEGRSGWFWTKTCKENCVCVVVKNGTKSTRNSYSSGCAVRPILQSSQIFSRITQNRVRGYNGTEEVEYGEYPQNVPDFKKQNALWAEYNRGMSKTGRSYTFNSTKFDGKKTEINIDTYAEYEFQGKKYILVKANFYSSVFECVLSNGIKYKKDDYVWVEVSPVKWLIDDNTGILISKKGLVSGVTFLDKKKQYKGNFSKTKMKDYLDNYMFHDLTQNISPIQEENLEGQLKEEKNVYNFNMNKVSEEEIIRGAIESGVAVFLHGPSSEGKSARVKQIDPTCEIIYLRNATPDSLNGKSVYNASTGEMIDVKPSWLKKLEAKCEQEPERLHVLFLDEITNALPSIQGMAFNIVLNGEVNGIWKLPENARIVAAGNDMKDSLAANQLAEPLFNRFAHVYIKTTTESWLKWASENNIHPAIYSYIAYKNGETLRSKYDGEYPNADPRKWEMASKMLYKTGRPEMLRALVGEDITREFVQFYNQRVITLDDVINGNYNDKDVQGLNTAERYATTMGLSCVSEENLEVVRDFANILGKEFKTVFDSLWTHGDEKRLERLAEAKLAEMQKGVSRKL